MRTTFYCVVVAMAMAACGGSAGPSGVDSNKHINTLSTSEAQTFCEWAVEEQGGAGHVTDCGGGVMVTADTVAECETNQANLVATCAATVADAEACMTAMGADPCNFEHPECAALIACTPG